MNCLFGGIERPVCSSTNKLRLHKLFLQHPVFVCFGCCSHVNTDECDFELNQDQKFITLKHYKSKPDELAVKETVIVSRASPWGSFAVISESLVSEQHRCQEHISEEAMLPYSWLVFLLCVNSTVGSVCVSTLPRQTERLSQLIVVSAQSHSVY